MSDENATTHTLVTPTATAAEAELPKTATKPVRMPKKRGRKGDKLKNAFKQIPATAVDFEEYAATHGVSAKSLRQIKRHDPYKESGKVFVRKEKASGRMLIWRDPNQRQ
jgi:hypothetical protein